MSMGQCSADRSLLAVLMHSETTHQASDALFHCLMLCIVSKHVDIQGTGVLLFLKKAPGVICTNAVFLKKNIYFKC